jgi:hypothetical protein
LFSLREIAEKTSGLTIDHLKEVITALYCFEATLDKVIEDVRKIDFSEG